MLSSLRENETGIQELKKVAGNFGKNEVGNGKSQNYFMQINKDIFFSLKHTAIKTIKCKWVNKRTGIVIVIECKGKEKVSWNVDIVQLKFLEKNVSSKPYKDLFSFLNQISMNKPIEQVAIKKISEFINP